MKIKTIHYSALINLGNYSNERIGFTAEVDEDDSIIDAFTVLRQKVEDNASLNSDKVRSMLYNGRNELNELKDKISKATDEWNRVAEFLRTQGIKPDAPDMPEFKMLLPEFKNDSSKVVEGEFDEEEEEEE